MKTMFVISYSVWLSQKNIGHANHVVRFGENMSVFLLSLFVACQGRQPKPPQDPIPKTVETPPEEPAPVEEVEEVEEVEDEVVERLVANFQRVYFELNSSERNEESKTALDENIVILQKELDVRIEVQGHADERGTTQYNVTLGEKRAEKVSQYIRMQGISESRIQAVSFGEEKPAAYGAGESIWSKNRRCEFRVVRSSNPDIKGTTE